MNREEYSDDIKSLINQFKKEAIQQGYDDNWINKIIKDATSCGEWYLRSTLIFNLQFLDMDGEDVSLDRTSQSETKEKYDGTEGN